MKFIHCPPSLSVSVCYAHLLPTHYRVMSVAYKIPTTLNKLPLCVCSLVCMSRTHSPPQQTTLYWSQRCPSLLFSLPPSRVLPLCYTYNPLSSASITTDRFVVCALHAVSTWRPTSTQGKLIFGMTRTQSLIRTKQG